MNQTRVLIIIAVLLTGLIMFASPVASQSDTPTELNQQNIFQGTDRINVWQESVRFFRVDTSNAEQRVRNPAINLEVGDSQDGLGKNFIAAYDPNTQISINYPKTDDVNTALTGQDVQVIAARAEPTKIGDTNYQNTFSDALDTLTSDDTNENASYYLVNNGDTLSNSEHNTYKFSPPKTGHYTFFIAATNGDHPIDITNQKITFTDNITIIGGDSASVQEGSATVTPPSNPSSGETIRFDVDTTNNLSSSGVTHAIAVYEQDTFRNSFHVIDLVNEPDSLSDLDIQQDTEFRHSIARVNGTATIEDGASVNGLQLSDGKVSRAVGKGAMIDFIGEELNRGGQIPPTRTLDDTVLNASLDADVDEDGDHTLEIKTSEDWRPGTYEYMYIGTLEDNKSAVSTQTGTFNLSSSDDTENFGVYKTIIRYVKNLFN